MWKGSQLSGKYVVWITGMRARKNMVGYSCIHDIIAVILKTVINSNLLYYLFTEGTDLALKALIERLKNSKRKKERDWKTCELRLIRLNSEKLQCKSSDYILIILFHVQAGLKIGRLFHFTKSLIVPQILYGGYSKESSQ